MKKLVTFIVLALLLTFWATPVYAAVPALPHAFYGNVTITGITTTPDGSQISATVDVDSGEIVATQNPVATVGGSYGFNSPKLLVQGDITPGANITFYVNGYEATPSQAATYEVGGGPTLQDLTVAAVAPSLVTSSATSVTTSRATLRGSLDNFGTALSADVSFEWGTTTAYGNTTAVVSVGLTGDFSATLTGLSSNTTYHFRAVAVGHGTDYGADRTFTTAARPPSPAAPPVLPAGTTDVRGMITTTGVFSESVTAASEDELCTLDIPEGTVGLTEELEPIDEITVVEMDEPPPPPEDAHVVGLAYDLGPSGATFEPAITLTFSYDPADIPEGVAESDLVLAYYDEATGKWVELDGVVDTENNTITASVPHFTTFAVIGRVPVVVAPPAPAAFTTSSLGVSPSEVAPGEEVNISVLVANIGGESGSYSVVLKVNDVKEQEKLVTITAGGSRSVSFTVTKEEADSYAVTVAGLSGSFTVVPVVVPPELAAFSVSYLSVSPRLEVEPGESVAITVLVANTGGESGSYTVVLKIDGVKEAEETVTVAAGESQDVSFSLTRDEPGTYSVAVDGLSGSFTVVAPPEGEEEEVPTEPEPGINWPLYGGIIGAAVIVAGLLIYVFVFRRREY